MNEVTKELGIAARGGIIALIGMVVSALFGFFTRTVIGRVYGPSAYGAYNVAFTIFNLAVVVVLLGFPLGLQRQVSYFKEKTPQRLERLISTALILVVISSSLGMIFVELKRYWLAEVFLSDEARRKTLSNLLGIIAVAIPFFAIFTILISITQGLKRVREYVIYGRIYQPMVYFVAVLIVSTVYKSSIEKTGIAYTITLVLVLILLIRDMKKNQILPLRMSFDVELAKSLLVFSIPLMTSGIVGFIMTWTDTLMLGHYKGSTPVGIYNAAAPLARFIPVFLSAFTVIYNPIATKFYAQRKLRELTEFYTSIMKWTFLLTFPLFELLVLTPSLILGVMFGDEYVTASVTLLILSLGYVFQPLLGPTGYTLVAIGKPSQDMNGNLLGAILNVILNFILIPPYGLLGAAIATSSSYIVANLYKTAIIWRENIRPFNMRYFQLVLIGILIICFGWTLPLSEALKFGYSIIGATSLYVGSILIGAVDEKDIAIIKMTAQKVGINCDRLISILEKYSTKHKN